MEYKYVPKSCVGKDARFEGHVVLKGLDFDRKMDLLEKMHEQGIDFHNIENMKDKPFEMMKVVRKLVKDTAD